MSVVNRVLLLMEMEANEDMRARDIALVTLLPGRTVSRQQNKLVFSGNTSTCPYRHVGAAHLGSSHLTPYLP